MRPFGHSIAVQIRQRPFGQCHDTRSQADRVARQLMVRTESNRRPEARGVASAPTDSHPRTKRSHDSRGDNVAG